MIKPFYREELYVLLCLCEQAQAAPPAGLNEFGRLALNHVTLRVREEMAHAPALANGVDYVKVTAENLTDEQIRALESTPGAPDQCAVCGSGLLAPEHHNDLMNDHHAFSSIRDACVTALYEFDYPSARVTSRARIAASINARREGSK